MLFSQPASPGGTWISAGECLPDPDFPDVNCSREYTFIESVPALGPLLALDVFLLLLELNSSSSLYEAGVGKSCLLFPSVQKRIDRKLIETGELWVRVSRYSCVAPPCWISDTGSKAAFQQRRGATPWEVWGRHAMRRTTASRVAGNLATGTAPSSGRSGHSANTARRVATQRW